MHYQWRMGGRTVNLPDPKDGNQTAVTRAWQAQVSRFITAMLSSGTTADRPTSFLYVGRTYFDTSLGAAGKPIWYNGTNWVDATGATV